MTNVAMDIILRLSEVEYRGSDEQWWTSGDYLREIVFTLDTLDVADDLAYAGISGSDDFQHFDFLADLAAAAQSWKSGIYVISPQPSEDGSFMVGLTLKQTGFKFTISLGQSALAGANVVDKLCDFTVALYRSLKEDFLFGNRLGVEVYDVDYPQIRPPRYSSHWEASRIVDFINIEYHQKSPRGRMEDVEVLLAAGLPEGVRKEQIDDLVILRWIEHLDDQDAVARQLSERDRWFAEHLNLPIDPDYNEAGDKMESQIFLEEHEILTFYSPSTKTGYKATAVNPDGSLDDELLDQIATWKENGRLSDETRIDRINLLLPSRESAVRIMDAAKSVGVDKVLYVDNEGNWWNPDPSGNWYNPSKD